MNLNLQTWIFIVLKLVYLVKHLVTLICSFHSFKDKSKSSMFQFEDDILEFLILFTLVAGRSHKNNIQSFLKITKIFQCSIRATFILTLNFCYTKNPVTAYISLRVLWSTIWDAIYHKIPYNKCWNIVIITKTKIHSLYYLRLSTKSSWRRVHIQYLIHFLIPKIVQEAWSHEHLWLLSMYTSTFFLFSNYLLLVIEQA